jgi:hypothetical protein
MTKRDFFILIIKLFGLQAILVALFSIIPEMLSYTFRQTELSVTIWFIVMLVILIGLCWLLIYEGHKIVDFMNLGSGFTDDKIELGTLKSEDIIKAGTFIIGGFMIVGNTAELISQIFWTLIGGNNGLEFGSKERFNLTVRGLNVLIGYLLITKLNTIARLLTNRKQGD